VTEAELFRDLTEDGDRDHDFTIRAGAVIFQATEGLARDPDSTLGRPIGGQSSDEVEALADDLRERAELGRPAGVYLGLTDSQLIGLVLNPQFIAPSSIIADLYFRRVLFDRHVTWDRVELTTEFDDDKIRRVIVLREQEPVKMPHVVESYSARERLSNAEAEIVELYVIGDEDNLCDRATEHMMSRPGMSFEAAKSAVKASRFFASPRRR
jgi:hypothetical protein